MIDGQYAKQRLKRQKGRKSEKAIAKRLGARLHMASGALDFDKADASTEYHLIEAKSTVKKSISLKLEWLLHVFHQATQAHKMPVIAISFTLGDGTPRKDGTWYLIREIDFTRMAGED